MHTGQKKKSIDSWASGFKHTGIQKRTSLNIQYIFILGDIDENEINLIKLLVYLSKYKFATA